MAGSLAVELGVDHHLLGGGILGFLPSPELSFDSHWFGDRPVEGGPIDHEDALRSVQPEVAGTAIVDGKGTDRALPCSAHPSRRG
jgi:hypothetical protein